MKQIAVKLSSLSLAVLLGMICSKTVTVSSSDTLKDAVTKSFQNLNNAMTEISSSQAFQFLSG